MRALSSPLNNAIGAAVQRPALLVSIGFATVRRWTSGAALSWSGQSWTEAPLEVEGLEVGALTVAGTLTVGNLDGVIGGLVLSEGIQDKAISLYGYDAAAIGAADVVWLCDAVGAGAQIDARAVRIALRHRAQFVAAPRTYVNAAAGFTQLLPEGTVLRINGVDLTLSRSG